MVDEYIKITTRIPEIEKKLGTLASEIYAIEARWPLEDMLNAAKWINDTEWNDTIQFREMPALKAVETLRLYPFFDTVSDYRRGNFELARVSEHLTDFEFFALFRERSILYRMKVGKLLLNKLTEYQELRSELGKARYEVIEILQAISNDQAEYRDSKRKKKQPDQLKFGTVVWVLLVITIIGIALVVLWPYIDTPPPPPPRGTMPVLPFYHNSLDHTPIDTAVLEIWLQNQDGVLEISEIMLDSYYPSLFYYTTGDTLFLKTSKGGYCPYWYQWEVPHPSAQDIYEGRYEIHLELTKMPTTWNVSVSIEEEGPDIYGLFFEVFNFEDDTGWVSSYDFDKERKSQAVFAVGFNSSEYYLNAGFDYYYQGSFSTVAYSVVSDWELTRDYNEGGYAEIGYAMFYLQVETKFYSTLENVTGAFALLLGGDINEYQETGQITNPFWYLEGVFP
jgi:hypothetical protein